MSTKDLVQNLDFEYYGIVAANPDWQGSSLFDFLVGRGVEPEDIYAYSEAEWPEDLPLPEWA